MRPNNRIRFVLFDLDGTLLPMDQEVFIRSYFSLLTKRLAPHGYDPQRLIAAIWEGTGAMVKNDGSRRNEEAFWEHFATQMGAQALQDKPFFDAFYREDFANARAVCGFQAEAAGTVRLVKALGAQPILATNPIFPAIATEQRIRWAGLRPEDFAWITSYENSRFCKPNPDYYREILKQLGADPESCIMVGNDATEDLAAASIGVRVFLLTDCLINTKSIDLSPYPHGGYPELQAYLQEQCSGS